MFTKDQFDIHHVLRDPPDLLQVLGLSCLVLVSKAYLGSLQVVVNLDLFILGLYPFSFVRLDDHLFAYILTIIPFSLITSASSSNSDNILLTTRLRELFLDRDPPVSNSAI